MKHLIKKGEVLTEEALGYIQEFQNKIFVVKYGGKAMINDELKKAVMKDIALLKTVGVKVVVVHGGGPNINEEMEQKGLKPKFVNGLRVTDEETLKIVKVIFKEINDEICSLLEGFKIKTENVEACLICGQKNKELGLVGEIKKVDAAKIIKVIQSGKIPVISPIGIRQNGKQEYNINADTAATMIAIALKAEKLTLMTDVDGVLHEGKLISHLSEGEINKLIKEGIITKGMIPKVEACLNAVDNGVKKAHLINGTILHSLLFEIFTKEGVGTEIVKNGEIK
jgi:acetylglutamate kinase